MLGIDKIEARAAAIVEMADAENYPELLLDGWQVQKARAVVGLLDLARLVVSDGFDLDDDWDFAMHLEKAVNDLGFDAMGLADYLLTRAKTAA